jgi:uncharacterized protein (TIGR04255 family)
LDVPPIAQQFETFGAQPTWSGSNVRYRLSQDLDLRLQIRNEMEDRMIQVQNGRVHLNWMKRGDKDYPRYRQILPQFQHVLARFRNFLDDNEMGSISPNQWEVTYVNHFPRGTVWEKVEDWSCLLPGLAPPAAVSRRVSFETFNGRWQFEIPMKRGRLHVELSHSQSAGATSQEALVLKLTARGPVDRLGEPEDAWARGLDLGRQAIVLTFKDLSSPAAHRYWGIKE